MSYEKEDLPFIGLVAFIGGVAALLILTLAIAVPLLHQAESFEAGHQPPDHPLADETAVPPEPRLQVAPSQELTAHETRVKIDLDTYGRTEGGQIHIPIERAMDLVLEEGLLSEEEGAKHRRAVKGTEVRR